MFITKVNQQDFGASGNEGRCLAISALWCKLIVETGAYTSLTDRFFQWFDKDDIKKRQRLLTLRTLTQEIKDKQDAYSANNINTAGKYSKKWDDRMTYLKKTSFNYQSAELNKQFPMLPPTAEVGLSKNEEAVGLDWENSRASKNKPPAYTELQGLAAKRGLKAGNLAEKAIELGIFNCGLKITHGTRINFDSALNHIAQVPGCYTLSLTGPKASKHTMAVCFLATKDNEGNEFVFFDPSQYEIYCTKAELATVFTDLKKQYSAEWALIYQVINSVD